MALPWSTVRGKRWTGCRGGTQNNEPVMPTNSFVFSASRRYAVRPIVRRMVLTVWVRVWCVLVKRQAAHVARAAATLHKAHVQSLTGPVVADSEKGMSADERAAKRHAEIEAARAAQNVSGRWCHRCLRFCLCLQFR